MPAPKPMIDRETLERLYLAEKKSMREIGELFGWSPHAVRRQLRRLGIETFGRVEAARFACQTGKIKPQPVTVKLMDEVTCRKCGAAWPPSGKALREKCPYCGSMKDVRDRTGYWTKRKDATDRKNAMLAWASVPENARKQHKEYMLLLRKRVFFRITGSIHHWCVRCGCDDFRLLEINHKNGGGRKELLVGRKTKARAFYHAIANGERKTDDLELLCRPCNAIHYLELLHGPLPMKVVWKGS
jgi:predicted  nucleic acid-binding Zn-ribbon protein